MKLARVILFTAQMDAMSKFYGEVLGLSQISNEKGWREFAAGARTHRAAFRPVITWPQRSENCVLRERRSGPPQKIS